MHTDDKLYLHVTTKVHSIFFSKIKTLFFENDNFESVKCFFYVAC